MSNIPSRRKALGQLAAMTAAPMLAASPFRHVYAQTAKQIRVGYLHIPSCDSQMWLMKEYGLLGQGRSGARYSPGSIPASKASRR
jgi:hypothetical protein